MNSTQIIDAIGGVAETARLCDISMAAVSQWKENGVPKTQLKFLQLARPEIFKSDTDKKVFSG